MTTMDDSFQIWFSNCWIASISQAVRPFWLWLFFFSLFFWLFVLCEIDPLLPNHTEHRLIVCVCAMRFGIGLVNASLWLIFCRCSVVSISNDSNAIFVFWTGKKRVLCLTSIGFYGSLANVDSVYSTSGRSHPKFCWWKKNQTVRLRNERNWTKLWARRGHESKSDYLLVWLAMRKWPHFLGLVRCL